MQAYLSPAIADLPRAIVAAFADAQDVIAERLAAGWKGQIQAIDLIDTGNYLSAVEVEGIEATGDVRTVTVGAERASAYAAAIRRKGESDYAGQRVAEDAIKAADAEIKSELERAGRRLA